MLLVSLPETESEGEGLRFSSTRLSLVGETGSDAGVSDASSSLTKNGEKYIGSNLVNQSYKNMVTVQIGFFLVSDCYLQKALHPLHIWDAPSIWVLLFSSSQSLPAASSKVAFLSSLLYWPPGVAWSQPLIMKKKRWKGWQRLILKPHIQSVM